jgi:hypothetical protein
MKKYFWKKTKKEPWQIAAARYCVDNSEEGFTDKDLKEYIKSLYNKVSEVQINQFFEEEIYKPTGREYHRNWFKVEDKNKWTPPLDLVSKITDYDELQEARESSRKAMNIATGSLIVAIIVGIVEILTSIYK